MRYIICAVLLILPLHVKAQEQSADMSSDALSHIENDEHANIWGAQDLKNALTRWLGDHDVRVDERTSIGPLDAGASSIQTDQTCAWPLFELEHPTETSTAALA